MPSYESVTAPAPPHPVHHVHHVNFTNLFLQGLAELIGTFFFIFIGLGSVPAALKASEGGNSTSLLTISLAFGFGLAIAVFIVYRISGGVLNPAISIALIVTKNFTVLKGSVYIVAQLLGAQLAGHAVRGLLPTGSDFSLANSLNGINSVQGIIVEAILTAPLVLIVYFQAVEKSKVTFLAPLFIGIYVFVAHLVLSPFTGTSLNPARSWAGAVVSGDFSDHYVFWVGPILGALLAALFYELYKKVDYLKLNGGQDADHPEGSIRLPN
ncbi:hypothetical protein HK096_005876 [Nowakowskiella sp. JEL0078]|nr:hypothetical protein HK096_005876 [Nowakowskiella sp. JEL0078]